VNLKKGEEQQIQIKVPPAAFEVIDDSGHRFIDSSSFTLYAGVSQPDKLSSQLTGCECTSIDIVL
jgi:beta-glucosidase